MIARRMLVKGRVQGVFFRAWTIGLASELGLSGWVRNLKSGDVEIWAEGDEEAVSSLIRACRSGPPSANVTNLEVEAVKPEGLSSFEKRPTG